MYKTGRNVQPPPIKDISHSCLSYGGPGKGNGILWKGISGIHCTYVNSVFVSFGSCTVSVETFEESGGCAISEIYSNTMQFSICLTEQSVFTNDSLLMKMKKTC